MHTCAVRRLGVKSTVPFIHQVYFILTLGWVLGLLLKVGQKGEYKIEDF